MCIASVQKGVHLSPSKPSRLQNVITPSQITFFFFLFIYTRHVRIMYQNTTTTVRLLWWLYIIILKIMSALTARPSLMNPLVRMSPTKSGHYSHLKPPTHGRGSTRAPQWRMQQRSPVTDLLLFCFSMSPCIFTTNSPGENNNPLFQ